MGDPLDDVMEGQGRTRKKMSLLMTIVLMCPMFYLDNKNINKISTSKITHKISTKYQQKYQQSENDQNNEQNINEKAEKMQSGQI